MATRYFVDPATNAYLGGYDGRSLPQKFQGMLEVQNPPEHAQDTWTGSGWDTSTRQESVVRKRERLQKDTIMRLAIQSGLFTQDEINERDQVL